MRVKSGASARAWNDCRGAGLHILHRGRSLSRIAIPPAHLTTLSHRNHQSGLGRLGPFERLPAIIRRRLHSKRVVLDRRAETLTSTHTPSTSFAKSTIHRYSFTTLLYLFAEDSNHHHLRLRTLESLFSLSVSRRSFRLGRSSRERTTTPYDRRRHQHNTRRTNKGGRRICLGG